MEDLLKLTDPATAREFTGGISESTQRRLITLGDYPKPVVLNRDRHGRPVRIAFVHGELVEWNRRRITAYRGETTPR